MPSSSRSEIPLNPGPALELPAWTEDSALCALKWARWTDGVYVPMEERARRPLSSVVQDGAGSRLAPRVFSSRPRRGAQPAPGLDIRHCRVGEEFLREVIQDPTSCEIFSCGPGLSNFDKIAARERGEEAQPRFLETVLTDLKNVGIAGWP
jgi:hypothetical protein